MSRLQLGKKYQKFKIKSSILIITVVVITPRRPGERLGKFRETDPVIKQVHWLSFFVASRIGPIYN